VDTDEEKSKFINDDYDMTIKAGPNEFASKREADYDDTIKPDQGTFLVISS
jgi:hypothetical protein